MAEQSKRLEPPQIEFNPTALRNLRSQKLSGDELAGMFKLIAQNAELCNSEESAAVLRYKTDGTAKVGEYIPSIQLVCTRVTEENLDFWAAEEKTPSLA